MTNQVEILADWKSIEKMKLGEIAVEIHERMQRLEIDPAKNPIVNGNNKHYYFAQAYAAGRFVMVRNRYPLQVEPLSMAEAGRYLNLLRHGYVGRYLKNPELPDNSDA